MRWRGWGRLDQAAWRGRGTGVSFEVGLQDLRHIFVSAPFGSDTTDKRRVVLEAMRVAGIEPALLGGPMGLSLCLEVSDSRLAPFLAGLRGAGVRFMCRAERRFTRGELDRSAWLLCRVATVGITASANLAQAFDRTAACRECGAGSRPIPPLLAELGRMGRKKIDHAAHDGQLVVTADLGLALKAAGLTGLSLHPVMGMPRGVVSGEYLWLRIDSELPPIADGSVFEREEPCDLCGRSGHFDTYEIPTELRYAPLPDGTCDFNRTYEYWGTWKHGRVGGKQWTVISQRARRAMLAAGARRLVFEPIARAFE
jgi:hypothetical protein